MLEKKDRAKAKVAAYKAEEQRLEKEIRKQQGQLEKAAQAAIGAVVLGAIAKGWVTVDADRLRVEAVASLPPRRNDLAEAIADLIETALTKPTAIETAASAVDLPIAPAAPKMAAADPAPPAGDGLAEDGPPPAAASPRELAPRDPIDDLLHALMPRGEQDQGQPAKRDADLALLAGDGQNEGSLRPGKASPGERGPSPGMVAATPPGAPTGFRHRPSGRPHSGMPLPSERKPGS